MRWQRVLDQSVFLILIRLIERTTGEFVELGAVLLKDFPALLRTGVADLTEDGDAFGQRRGDDMLLAGLLASMIRLTSWMVLRTERISRRCDSRELFFRS